MPDDTASRDVHLPPCSSLRRACLIRRAPCKKVLSTFMDSVHRNKIGLFPEDAVIYIKHGWVGWHAQDHLVRSALLISANECNASMRTAEEARQGFGRHASLHMAGCCTCCYVSGRFRWLARLALARSVSHWSRCPSCLCLARSGWYTFPARTGRLPNSWIVPMNRRSTLQGCNRCAPYARQRPMRHCRYWMQLTTRRWHLPQPPPSADSPQQCPLRLMRSFLRHRRRRQRCRRWTSPRRRSLRDWGQPDYPSRKDASPFPSFRRSTIVRRRCLPRTTRQ